jgi:murein DD-endopeptidase MepM/ murein hydrolase activator NlpD
VQHYVDRDPGPGALDYRCGRRTYDKHDGIDIRLLDMAAQRQGVDVIAAAAGKVIAVRDGVPDISIRAPGAPSVAGHECGNRVGLSLGDGWIIDYCHLAKGSIAVKAGDQVALGQRLGRVGLSGDTEFPHVHFSVRHNNAVVDPFAPGPVAPGACPVQTGLWTPQAARALAYKRGAVINAGFGAALAKADEIEDRAVPAPSAASPALVAYVRLIGLEAGDVVETTLTGPDGKVLATGAQPPLDHDKDVWTSQIGRKRPAGGWAAGTYVAKVQVRRAGAVALTHAWRLTL